MNIDEPFIILILHFHAVADTHFASILPNERDISYFLLKNCRTHNTETPELVNTQPLPCSMEFETILLNFLHNTAVNMLYRLFSGRKYMYIYLPIHQIYGYLGKQKISLYFPASTYEHL